MRRVIAVLASVVLLGLAAHGAGAQGKNQHGAAVARVAAGTCVFVNPNNPKVKNHGQCVAQAARTNSGKHGAGTKDHGKHLGHSKGKGHAKTTQSGGKKAQPKGSEAPEPTEAPEATDTP
jgi:hypothetical protein